MTETLRTEPGRDQELRHILEGQRDRILHAVRTTLREGREAGAIDDGEVHDEAERSEVDVQSELAFAVLQMQGETLERITEALDRLDSGDYGQCVTCGEEISSKRLQALPFAARCRDCADESEAKVRSSAPIWSRREELSLFR